MVLWDDLTIHRNVFFFISTIIKKNLSIKCLIIYLTSLIQGCWTFTSMCWTLPNCCSSQGSSSRESCWNGWFLETKAYPSLPAILEIKKRKYVLHSTFANCVYCVVAGEPVQWKAFFLFYALSRDRAGTGKICEAAKYPVDISDKIPRTQHGIVRTQPNTSINYLSYLLLEIFISNYQAKLTSPFMRAERAFGTTFFERRHSPAKEGCFFFQS